MGDVGGDDAGEIDRAVTTGALGTTSGIRAQLHVRIFSILTRLGGWFDRDEDFEIKAEAVPGKQVTRWSNDTQFFHALDPTPTAATG